MYQPSSFAETRPEALHAFVREQPLGTLVTLDRAGALQADLVPFLLERGPTPHGTLRGHVARANPLWRDSAPGAEALVVFQGVEGYVSPAWYASKAVHGKVVPTWNYALVQARGPLRVVDDADWLRALVGRLTDHFEARRVAAAPAPAAWGVDDAPADYVEAMLRAIVGIEIDLASLVGKFKLSQNRDEADRDGAIGGLRALGDPAAQALADAMQRARG